jgi:lipoyl(octanoyl) transferase
MFEQRHSTERRLAFMLPAVSEEAARPTTRFLRLGRIEYERALALQDSIQAARRERGGQGDDVLLLLEHPPVLTLGRAATRDNIVATAEQLAAENIEVIETDRGGEVTYHGPGQLVGYPLLWLGPGRQDVRKYVRNLEETLIRAMADFSVVATRVEKWPGVWVENSRLGGLRKIAALGVHLSRWYTRHGFALNVSTNLKHFDLIVPCGIREASVTSLEMELNIIPDWQEIENRLIHHFGEVFGCRMASSEAKSAVTVH